MDGDLFLYIGILVGDSGLFAGGPLESDLYVGPQESVLGPLESGLGPLESGLFRGPLESGLLVLESDLLALESDLLVLDSVLDNEEPGLGIEGDRSLQIGI